VEPSCDVMASLMEEANVYLAPVAMIGLSETVSNAQVDIVNTPEVQYRLHVLGKIHTREYVYHGSTSHCLKDQMQRFLRQFARHFRLRGGEVIETSSAEWFDTIGLQYRDRKIFMKELCKNLINRPDYFVGSEPLDVRPFKECELFGLFQRFVRKRSMSPLLKIVTNRQRNLMSFFCMNDLNSSKRCIHVGCRCPIKVVGYGQMEGFTMLLDPSDLEISFRNLCSKIVVSYALINNVVVDRFYLSDVLRNQLLI